MKWTICHHIYCYCFLIFFCFYVILDSEITETDQLKKKLQRNAQATSSSIICNENAKIQSEEINAEKSKNIQYVKESEILLQPYSSLRRNGSFNLVIFTNINI